MSGAAHISEIELPPNPDHPESARWAIVRLHFGIRSFGINAWRAVEPGTTLIGEHDELGSRAGRHEELYFVADGRAMFTVAGDEIDAPAGTYVFVRDPAAKRGAVAEEPETTIVAVGAPAGEAFTPSPWERSARAFAYWSTDEFEKAVELLSKAHEEHPEDAGVLYNLACAESRLGRSEEAVDHLRRSVELDPQFAEIAADDSDFDLIREEPEYASAISGQAGSSRPAS
jgi:tetratricopeptide (TPR) repeat protein